MFSNTFCPHGVQKNNLLTYLDESEPQGLFGRFGFGPLCHPIKAGSIVTFHHRNPTSGLGLYGDTTLKKKRA